MPHNDSVVELLRLAPPRIEAEHPGVRVCILSTRVAIEVLRYLGLPARPFPCRVVAMNALAADAYGESRPLSETWEDGGYALGQEGTGERLAGNQFTWDGHLAALVEHYGYENGHEGALLIDLSLKDLHRPEKHIYTGVLRALVPQRLIDDRAKIHIPLARDGLALYEPIESDVWRRSPDWRERHRWAPIAGAVIRELRATARV